jgi:hypothetical protein
MVRRRGYAPSLVLLWLSGCLVMLTQPANGLPGDAPTIYLERFKNALRIIFKGSLLPEIWLTRDATSSVLTKFGGEKGVRELIFFLV